jgi:hypothetical protein
VNLHQFLRRRGRDPARRGGRERPGQWRERGSGGWQVGDEPREVVVGARGQRPLQPLVEFIAREPPVPGRDPKRLGDLVPVLM